MIFIFLAGTLFATLSYNFYEIHPLINFYIFNFDDGMRAATSKPVLICSPHLYSYRVRTINILSNRDVCALGHTQTDTEHTDRMAVNRTAREPASQRAKATNTGTYGFMCN